MNHKFKKTEKIFFALFVLFSTSAKAQNVTLLNQEDSSNVIDIVGYFCKGDTLEYENMQDSWVCTLGDTSDVSRYITDFRVIINDSTKNGYEMEYIPLNYSVCQETSEDETSSMKKNLEDITTSLIFSKHIHAKFTTDEFGGIKHIKNWKEIKTALYDGIEKTYDSLYQTKPGLDSIISRKNITAIIKLKISTEDGIKDVYKDMNMLFGLHGKEFDIGKTESTDSTGYPSKTILVASLENADKNIEDSYDGDYGVSETTVTKIPKEDIADLVELSLGILSKGEKGDSINNIINQYMKDSINGNITMAENEDYHYFFNGWPKKMRTQKIVNLAGFTKVAETDISWTKASCNNYKKDEEEQKKI